MAHLEAHVPERIEDAVHQLGKVRQRLAPCDHLAVVEKHKIDVAVRVQFGPAITADGYQIERWKLLSALVGKAGFGRSPQIAEQNIDQGGAAPANLTPTRSGAMEDFQPVRLDFEEIAIARQLLGRQSTWR